MTAKPFLRFRFLRAMLMCVPIFLRKRGPLKKYFWQPEDLAALETLDPATTYVVESETGLYWPCGTHTIQ